MREKRIGIITFHNSRNYGAVLQAYALQKKLSEYFGVAEVIDYRNAEIERSLRLRPGKVQSFSAFFRYVLAFIFRMHKKAAFDQFLHKYVRKSQKAGRVDLKQLSDVYDIYICGSDQVWNTELTGGDESYFLDFAGDDKCKAAYAASFGDTQIEISADMQKWLQKFGLITLREEGRCQELEALLHRPVKVCCDPTILLTGNMWRKIASGRLCRKPYVFLMMIEESGKVQEYAQKLAKEKNLILVSNKNCMRFFLHLTPADFLSWVCHAEYVVINSFHGTVFSLIFEKQFVSCRYSDQGNLKTRIAELLDKAGLGHRVTDNAGLDVDENVPWENVRDTLGQMRQYSWDIFFSWLSGLAGGNKIGKQD